MASQNITFSSAISSAFSRSFDYKGRSARAEYWWYYLFTFSTTTVLTGVFSIFGHNVSGVLIIIMLLLFVVPNIALIVRRAHDANIYAWKILLIISSVVGILGVSWMLSTGDTDNDISSVLWILLFGLYLSLNIVFFFISFIPGTKGDNRFGPDPLAAQGSTSSPSSGLNVEVYRQQFGPGAVAEEGKQSRAPATEEDPFDIAGRELHTGEKHVGTWARALVEGDGDSGRTEAAYVRLRVANLKAAAEADRAKAAAEAEALRLQIETSKAGAFGVKPVDEVEARELNIRAEAAASGTVFDKSRYGKYSIVFDPVFISFALIFIGLAIAFVVVIASTRAPTPNTASNPGWIADKITGCNIWNPDPQPNESVTWSGPCVAGEAFGQGVEQWYNKESVGNRIEGTIRFNRFQGNVTVNYPSGQKFVGTISDNGKIEHGTMYSPDGSERLIGSESRPHAPAKRRSAESAPKG